MKILELFGGIGACSAALTKLGIDFEVADYVEIDKFAVNSYNAMFGTDFETQDITEWDKDLSVDLIMHGSPCQDISAAGSQAGADPGSGTRSSLMYETLRIVEKLKPKYVIWENVKNLLSPKHIHNYEAYLQIMSDLGYKSFYKVINSKDFGVPQNRERIFTISILDCREDFVFPGPQTLTKSLKDILEPTVKDKYLLPLKQIKYIAAEPTGNEILKIGSTISGGEKSPILDPVGICSCLTATDYKQPKQIYWQGVARKLTPLECWRLQGFSDELFEKAQKVNSNTQLYKQCGNSITVNVLCEIFKNLLG